LHGLEVLGSIVDCDKFSCDLKKLKSFLGDKNYQSLCIKLIRNSYSNDVHFLPKDGEPLEWSSIPHHSLVLFRYPITVPIEFFELANDPMCLDWNGSLGKIARMFPIAKEFVDIKPMKTLSVQVDFLSDLLTRFVGLYVRIGSPDFTNDTIIDLVDEISNT
jgi:hypothetical protein